MNRRQIELITKLIDDELSDSEALALKAAIEASPDFRDEVVEAVSMEGTLRAFSRNEERDQEIADKVMGIVGVNDEHDRFASRVMEGVRLKSKSKQPNKRPTSVRPRRVVRRGPVSRPPWIFLGVAAILIVTFTAVFISRTHGPILDITPTIVEGKTSDDLTVGARLPLESKIAVAGNGALVARYNDQSTIKLKPGASICLVDTRGRDRSKRVSILGGTISAAITAQPEGRPLLIRTPHATIEVVGTSFQVVVHPASTFLRMFKGKVRFTNLLTGEVSIVIAGQTASTSAPPHTQPETPSRPSTSPLPDLPTPSIEPRIISFTLVDAKKDIAIPAYDPIPDGATISLSKLQTDRLNVLVNTAGSVSCAKILLDGKRRHRTPYEDDPPFLMAGDAHGTGDYHQWVPSIGDHVIQATAYSEPTGRGKASEEKTLHFRIVE